MSNAMKSKTKIFLGVCIYVFMAYFFLIYIDSVYDIKCKSGSCNIKSFNFVRKPILDDVYSLNDLRLYSNSKNYYLKSKNYNLSLNLNSGDYYKLKNYFETNGYGDLDIRGCWNVLWAAILTFILLPLAVVLYPRKKNGGLGE